MPIEFTIGKLYEHKDYEVYVFAFDKDEMLNDCLKFNIHTTQSKQQWWYYIEKFFKKLLNKNTN